MPKLSVSPGPLMPSRVGAERPPADGSAATPDQVERAMRVGIEHGYRAIEFDGSYFLTYHRYARRDQFLRCYPQMPEFLRRKRAFDPDERFSSDWHRHQVALLQDLF